MNADWMEVVTVVALVALTLGGSAFAIRAVKGPTLADRVVAIDGVLVTIVAATLVSAVRTGSGWFVDVGRVVGFVGFVGTTAAARFIEGRGD